MGDAIRDRLVARLQSRYADDPAVACLAPLLASAPASSDVVEAVARRLLALEREAPR